MTRDNEPGHPSEETIFENAIVLDGASAREEYLRSACGADAGQRERIEGLIRAHERAEDVLFLTSNREREKAATVEQPTAPIDRNRVPKSERPGETIDHFRLLKQIGQGGMGTVWLAGQAEPINREVALKIIRPGVDTKAVSTRFETERQALALMEHPHIARFLDAGVTASGTPYFAMEYVKGLRITTFCDRKILTVEQRLRLMVQVCRAVQHAHQKGVLHRDLKPSNILVTSQDGKPVPKVIDFGIAKALSEDAGHLGRTQGKQFLGTPAYMSPEQAGIARDIDARADIFSLGAVLYELLTGTAPIEPEQLRGANFEQILSIVHEAEAPAVSRRIVEQGEDLHDIAIHRRTEPGPLARALRGDLDWITDKAMSKERGRRYESAEELAKDIERHLADEPVIAGPPGRVYRARKFIRRYRGLVVASSSAAAALVVAFATSAFMYVRAEVALGAQAVATQKVLEEQRNKTAAQNEAEGLLRFAFEDLREQLEPTGQLQILGGFVDPAAAHFEPVESDLDDARLERLRMLLVFGDIRKAQGRLEEAAEFYDEARSIQMPGKIVDNQPDWAAAQFQAQLRLGRIRSDQERWEQAYRHFETAESLLSDETGNENQRAAILREMAESRRAARKLDAAIALGVRERELLMSLSDREPSNSEHLHSLADAQYHGAQVFIQANQLKKAEDLLMRAIDNLSTLIVGPEVDDVWRSSYYGSSTQLANLLNLSDRPEAALKRYAAARGVLRASGTRGVDWKSRLAESSLNIGKLHEKGTRYTTAEVAYHSALKYFTAAAEQQQSGTSFLGGQAKAHLALARVRDKQGRDITANREAGIKLARTLLTRDPLNEQWFALLGELKKLNPSSPAISNDKETEQ